MVGAIVLLAIGIGTRQAWVFIAGAIWLLIWIVRAQILRHRLQETIREVEREQERLPNHGKEEVDRLLEAHRNMRK